MASNNFKHRKYFDHVILGPDKKVVGTIRVKPSGVLWAAKGSKAWKGVDLETFAEFMQKNGKKQGK